MVHVGDGGVEGKPGGIGELQDAAAECRIAGDEVGSLTSLDVFAGEGGLEPLATGLSAGSRAVSAIRTHCQFPVRIS
jgi:hypothetical protein